MWNRVFTSVQTNFTFIQYCVHIIYILLFLYGDIEPNPGPIEDNAYTLDILHLNVRSIRNKIENLLYLVSDFDILCFTESHLDANVLDKDITIEGFNTIFRKDRNSFGGGVVIYVSDLLKAVRRFDLEPHNTECIWIEIHNLTFNIFLCCTYRPPSCDKSYWEHIVGSLEKVSDISNHIILVGDLNVVFLTFQTPTNSMKFSQTFL